MSKKYDSSREKSSINRLLAAGCPMPLQNVPESQPDLVIEVIKPEITIAYGQRSGAEYVFGVRITNLSYSDLELRRFRARFPWRARLYWLGDPRTYTPKTEVYRLEGSKREFPYGEVLNHRLGQNGRLGPKEEIEGVLLAYTMFDRIPSDCLHGTICPAVLLVEDQFGRKHRSEIELSIDRRATMKTLSLERRSRRLFEEEEPNNGTTDGTYVQPEELDDGEIILLPA